jgi:hypothetical protein
MITIINANHEKTEANRERMKANVVANQKKTEAKMDTAINAVQERKQAKMKANQKR